MACCFVDWWNFRTVEQSRGRAVRTWWKVIETGGLLPSQVDEQLDPSVKSGGMIPREYVHQRLDCSQLAQCLEQKYVQMYNHNSCAKGGADVRPSCKANTVQEQFDTCICCLCSEDCQAWEHTACKIFHSAFAIICTRCATAMTCNERGIALTPGSVTHLVPLMAHRAESRHARSKEGSLLSPNRLSGSDFKRKTSKERELASCQALYRAYQTLCTPGNDRSAYIQILQAGSGKLSCVRLSVCFGDVLLSLLCSAAPSRRS